MRTGILMAQRIAGDTVKYKLDIEGRQAETTADLPRFDLQPVSGAPRWATVPLTPQSTARQGSPSLLVNELMASLAPLDRELRRWALSDGSETTMCVHALGDLAVLPWELLPRTLKIPSLFVARLAQTDVSSEDLPSPPSPPVRMFAAGWSSLARAPMSGIARELAKLPEILGDERVQLTKTSEPTPKEFTEAYKVSRPEILHMASPAVRERDGKPEIAMSDVNGQVAWMSGENLADTIQGSSGMRLVVLNSCNSGIAAARLISERLAITTVGWAGWVPDEVAADFAFFFYERLLEGATPIAAVRTFLGRDSLEAMRERMWFPVVWLPSVAAEGMTIFAPPSLDVRTPTAGPRRGRSTTIPRSPRPITAEDRRPLLVNIEFELLHALNPALLKNGRTAIERLTVVSSDEVSNLRLQIECDTGSGCSVVRQMLNVAKGSHLVATNVSFPVLYRLIEEGVGRRQVNFTVTASTDGEILAETTRSALWMGAKEWMDKQETWPFIPSFVQPNSEAVLEIIGHADRTLRVIGSPGDAFDGYQQNDPARVRQQMRAIFTTLREPPYELSYINPPSGPVFVPGFRESAGQLVRLPDEVARYRRGTCHDLALLFASCAEHIGILPLVILVQGHTLCGFWTSDSVQQNYWNKVLADSVGKQSFGSDWMITSIEELRDLFKSGDIELVEATAVTDRNGSYDQAREDGERKLNELLLAEFDVAIDVAMARYQVQPV